MFQNFDMNHQFIHTGYSKKFLMELSIEREFFMVDWKFKEIQTRKRGGRILMLSGFMTVRFFKLISWFILVCFIMKWQLKIDHKFLWDRKKIFSDRYDNTSGKCKRPLHYMSSRSFSLSIPKYTHQWSIFHRKYFILIKAIDFNQNIIHGYVKL